MMIFNLYFYKKNPIKSAVTAIIAVVKISSCKSEKEAMRRHD